jgi:hypothetical protein
MKHLSLAAGLVCLMAMAAPPATVHAAETASFEKVQLMLKKLRDSMTSLKEFDELEKAGMSKKDVDRMRRAMKLKIQQMIDETVSSIHAL